MPRHALPTVAALAALLVAASPVSAQFDPPSKFDEVGDLAIEVVPAKAKRGETVTIKFTVTPKPGAWTYPASPKDAEQLAKNKFGVPKKAGDLIFPPLPVADPPGAKWKEKPRADAKKGETDQYSDGPVTWEFLAVVSPKTTPGPKDVGLDDLRTRIQVCTDQTCLYPRSLPTATLVILDGDPVEVAPQFQAAVSNALGAPGVPPAPKGGNPPGPNRGGPDAKPETLSAPAGQYPPKEPKPLDQYQAELDAIRASLDKSGYTDPVKDEPIGAFVLTAALWGLISLVTPCVFPMIPITVSIFLKHAHGSFRERMKLAGVYCATIIIVLGLSAFALLRFMSSLSVHPVTNALLGLLFVVLALSLFGMYELTLPNFMVRRLQAKQAKGGVIGTVFGALAFTVISFTCVAPFLGGFAGISAANASSTALISLPTTREILGGLAFATAFAAPFFVLALVPGLLKALPRSGGWLDSVKVVMGFLELAAALKFLRTAELGVVTPASFFTYDLVLAGWVAVSLACGLYLLNAFRLPHDEEKPNIGVPRLLFAVMFLGLGVYLAPGLLKSSDGKPQRPGGAVYAWVDAFLLPEPNTVKHLAWGTDLHDAIAKSRVDAAAKGGKPRPVFIDFTGVTCTNCSYNENTVFPQAKVNDLLQDFERVQLYTDWLPSNLYATDPGSDERNGEGGLNKKFKIDVFDTDQLPLYVVLVPTVDGKTKLLGVYQEGKINSADKFAAWLKDMLQKAKG